jgi:hypothetical protein
MKVALPLFVFASVVCGFAKEPSIVTHPQRAIILKSLQSLVDGRAQAEENHFFVRRVDDVDWIFWREGRRLLSTTLEPFAGDAEMSAEVAWDLRVRHCREQIDLDTAVVDRVDAPRNVITRDLAFRVVFECAVNGELVIVKKKPNKSPEPTSTRTP